MGKKRFWLDEDFARALQGLLGRDALSADAMTDANMSSSQTREIITCVLHADINNSVQRVGCTRLGIIQDKGTKKAWQVVVDPTSADSFTLSVNGTTIGPLTSSTTTAAFGAALGVITSPAAPRGWVVHGNFFVYPADTLVVASGTTVATAYEVPWIPLVGNADATTVGSRRLAKTGEFKRGSTQAAEYVHGYGFAIASAPASSTEGTDTSPTGCPCACIGAGDIIVNGVATTSQWKIPLTQQVFRQTYGTITVPAGLYIVVYSTVDERWRTDIGDVLTAAYTSGDDATEATTMDGTLTMEFDSYGVPFVSLCVDGTVPEQEG